jgi:proline iminopeptidase
MHGYLPVHGGHRIYYETHGDAGDPPIVVLHGGPGGGMQPELLPLFRGWYAVVFDQRGCGRSQPFGGLRYNRTADLVADIEALRERLGIKRWTVFGGSWGTTLGLAYAVAHPERVKAMIFRGTSLCDEASFRWLYEKGGASEICPEAWEAFAPPHGVGGGWRAVVRWYHRRIAAGGADGERAAKAWWRWEWALSRLRPEGDADGGTTGREARAIALLETRYFLNGCWLPHLAEDIRSLKMPLTMIHGRYDLVCPLSGAEAVREAMPHARLVVVEAGHAAADMMPTLRRVLRGARQGARVRARTRRRLKSRATQ